MARKEARTKVSKWNDPDHAALSASAQRTYHMLYSQAQITLLGVLSLTPGRWATFASDTSTEAIWMDLVELIEAKFIVVDRETEELLVRSFIHHDGVWNSPITRKVALGQKTMVVSDAILDALEIEIERAEGVRLDREAADATAADTKPQGNTLSATVPGGVADTDSDTHRAHAHAVSSHLLPSPVSNHLSPSPVSGSASDTAEAAFWLIAEKKLKERPASLDPVGDRMAWLRKVIEDDIRPSYQERALEIIGSQPDVSPDTLAWDLQRPANAYRVRLAAP